MATLRQICSDLIGDLKANNLDDVYSYRYLASKFRDKIAYFLRIEGRSREFLKNPNIWKTLPCVDLEEIPTTTCGVIDDCLSLKRTVIKIPDTYETSYGLSIKVYNITGEVEFKMINITDYRDYVNRPTYLKNPIFWVDNNYIYVPNTDFISIKVLLIPKEPIKVDAILNNNKCVFPLDGIIEYPEYLVNIAKKEILAELLPTKQIVEDEKGDDNTNRKN